MASKVQIGKLALARLGDRFDISDLEEEGTEAEQVNLVYDEARQDTLRMHPWRFAMKFSKPASLSVTVPGNWTYAYAYPTDAVRLLWLENPLGRDLEPIEYETALLSDNTRVVLTDQETPEFRYTADIDNPARYDASFVEAFSAVLAAKICMPLTGDRELAKAMMEDAKRAVSHAAAMDANEGRTKKPPEASWITARD